MFRLPSLFIPALLLAFCSSLAIAQDNNSEKLLNPEQQARYWYKIEALVFMQLIRDENSQEQLETPDSLEYPPDWKWVVTEEELQRFMASVDVSDMLQDIPNSEQLELLEASFKQDPILVGTVPEEFTRPDISSSKDPADPFVNEASSLEEALLSLQQQENSDDTQDETRFIPPKAFHHIEDKEQELADIWQHLRWSRGFRPLWFRSWHQPIHPERPDKKTTILVEGPKTPEGEKLIQGTISFWQESYLHTQADLWMFDYLPNVGQQPTPPEAPELRSPYKPLEPTKERGLLFRQIDQAIEQLFSQAENNKYQPFRFTGAPEATTTRIQRNIDSIEKDEFSNNPVSKDLAYQPLKLEPEDSDTWRQENLENHPVQSNVSLFSPRSLMLREPELKLSDEDFQSDEILLKTQPIYKTQNLLSRGTAEELSGAVETANTEFNNENSNDTPHSSSLVASNGQPEIISAARNLKASKTGEETNDPLVYDVVEEDSFATNEDFEHAQMLALTAPLIESYKRADFLDWLEKPRVQSKVWVLREKRRIKRGELHYFDHPNFGLILKITQYKTPEVTGDESADSEE